MIKGITFLRPVDSPAHFDDLVSFFSALGFEVGRGWDDPPLHKGASAESTVDRGRPFLAPLGNLEFVTGKLPAVGSDLLVEVTALDDLHRVAEQWIAQHAAAGRVDGVEETHWKSRLFTVEPVPGFSVAFWERQDLQRDRPIALEGDLSAAGLRFGIVVARWNAVITDRLLQGALDALLRSGAVREQIRVVRVPGSWEIPAAARTLAESGDLDAIIALGCLIRGETAHYEAIYNEVARGIGQSQQDSGIPHSFGVLTCETLEQALDRAGLKSGNKGFEAAAAAIEMASLQGKLAADSRVGRRA
ncbi:MAG TPA: 6,7-dimethyl-8-ribityllumazine synthase [Acidobacteriaceae bacterium]|jgi:6,7-dimethyl-8-ribityllumazine synthase|nr:6,7-dimethyl-8-ribityllumazine synthase [Acidobacteriaceae bacterium]